VRINLKDEAEGIFDVAHPAGLFSGIVFADRHPLLAAVFDNLFYQSFSVRILNAKVKGACFPVLEVFRRFIVFKFKHCNTNFITRGHVCDFERPPALAEHINTLLPYWRV
jgi:hypothetical protein